MAGEASGTGPAARAGNARAGRVERPNPRPALALDEVLHLLLEAELIDEQSAREIESRATTLRSRVLKEQVGSVRSQAAARYEVSPAELIAIAGLPHPTNPQIAIVVDRRGVPRPDDVLGVVTRTNIADTIIADLSK